MPRARQFDHADVLEAAMRRFWEHGYEGTSIRDLTADMGITATSLYNAFGDKRRLFDAALAHYLRNQPARFERLARTLPPRDAALGFLAELVSTAECDAARRGCFLVNTAIERAPHDDALGRFVEGRLGEIATFLGDCMTRAHEDGTIRRDLEPAALTTLLLAVAMGIRVLHRVGLTREDGARLLAAASAAIRAPMEDDKSLESLRQSPGPTR